jgi:predicted nuclease of predicted toxin-antitoxin system
MRFLGMRTSRASSLSGFALPVLMLASVRETTPGVSDNDILDEADSDDRVLITEDRDFGELVVRQWLKVRGIFLLELDRVPSAA